jgi:hypothetical protein
MIKVISASLTVAFLAAGVALPASADDDGPLASGHRRRAITYNASLIADVTIAGQTFHGAVVNLSMEANTATVTPLKFGSSTAYKNTEGEAFVTVISRGKVIKARFHYGMIYAFFDPATASIGFGSLAGGPAYPLSLTNDPLKRSTIENSSVGAIADILTTPANAVNYTNDVASLATNLRNETVLSGPASSCVAFDPATLGCSNFTPVYLATDKGPFALFEPYYDAEADPVTPKHTVNFGIFWSELK